MNKAFKRTKFNKYKWFTTITVTSLGSLVKGDIISIGDKFTALITAVSGNTITVFDRCHS